MNEPTSLRIPARKAPSFFNRSAAAGLGLGLILPIGGLVGVAALIASTVIGGYLGKQEMEQDVHEGKLVSKPDLLAKESVKDGLIGAGIGGIVGTVLAVGIIAMGVATAMIPVGASVAVVAAAAAPYVVAAAIATWSSVAIGGIAGLFHGKKRMEKEWQEAKAHVAQFGEYSKGQAPEKAKSPYVDSVTPAEYQTLEHAQANASHTDRATNAADLTTAPAR